MSSYEGAQQSRKDGALVRSKANLRLCISSCPTALAADCQSWMSEVETAIARIQIEVRDERGQVIPGVVTILDGVGRTSGEIVELDPGPHDIEASAPGFTSSKRRIEVKAGTSTTPRLVLEPQRLASGQSSGLLGPLLLGGGGLLALGVGGILALVGHLEVSDMRDSCAPGCPQDRVDDVTTLWTAAGVLAGLGGATAIASGVWLGLTLAPGTATTIGRGAELGLKFPLDW